MNAHDPADEIRVHPKTMERYIAIATAVHPIVKTSADFVGVYFMGHLLREDAVLGEREIIGGALVPAWHVDRLREFVFPAPVAVPPASKVGEA